MLVLYKNSLNIFLGGGGIYDNVNKINHYQCAAKEEVAGAEVRLSSLHLTSTGSHVFRLPLLVAVPKYPEGYL